MRCRDRNGERDVAPPRLVRREFGDRPDRRDPAFRQSDDIQLGSCNCRPGVHDVDSHVRRSIRRCANLVAVQQGRDHGEWLLACGECGLCVPRLSTMGTRGCKITFGGNECRVLMNCWCRCRCLLQPFPEQRSRSRMQSVCYSREPEQRRRHSPAGPQGQQTCSDRLRRS